MNNDITCIVLSGGKSSRMGSNKALLKLKEKTIIEHLINLLKTIFDNVILITNNNKEYNFLDIPIYQDIYREMGPLAGIHTGLVNSKTNNNFIISCDVPLINKKTIEYIINSKKMKQITICKADEHLQQLVGIYSKSVIPTIEEILESNKKRSVYSLLNIIEYDIIDLDKSKFYREGMFLNMNKPEDYKKVLAKF